ncbi:MAG TPA: sulfite exporter TauE/SafE family protein, partial [Burkholderiales bacterium]|nr:sulfite exporter TauE/SafE family protein [Burkholderiales bacterium]
MDWWWAYLAVGVFVGFFSGLLGIGGGSAMVPLLAFIFAAKGFPAQYV